MPVACPPALFVRAWVQNTSVYHFPFKCGFGIIALLKCPRCPASVRRECRRCGCSTAHMNVVGPAVADVAQSAEHPPCKRAVTSSILVVGSASRSLKTYFHMGSYPSGQRGLTVNQLSDDFGGSNPSLPTCARIPALPACVWQAR